MQSPARVKRHIMLVSESIRDLTALHTFQTPKISVTEAPLSAPCSKTPHPIITTHISKTTQFGAQAVRNVEKRVEEKIIKKSAGTGSAAGEGTGRLQLAEGGVQRPTVVPPTASLQINSDPRVRQILKSKNCAVVISRSGSPVSNNIPLLSHKSSNYSSSKTPTSRTPESVYSSDLHRDLENELTIRTRNKELRVTEIAKTVKTTVCSTPRQPEQLKPEEIQTQQLNNRYKAKQEPSSLSLDQEITSADGSMPQESSTSSFQNNLKLKMNESFISQFQKLTESEILINDSDLQKCEVNRIIMYEEMKEYGLSNFSSTSNSEFQRMEKHVKDESAIRKEDMMMTQVRLKLKELEQKFQARNVTPPRVLPNKILPLDEAANQFRKLAPSAKNSINYGTSSQGGSQRVQYGHKRSKSDIGGLGTFVKKESATLTFLNRQPLPGQVKRESLHSRSLTPSGQRTSEKENKASSGSKDALPSSQKKVLGSVVNTLFSESLRGVNIGRKELDLRGCRTPTNMKPYFLKTSTLSKTPMAPQKKLQLHYCL